MSGNPQAKPALQTPEPLVNVVAMIAVIIPVCAQTPVLTLQPINQEYLKSTLWAIPAREDRGVGHGTQKPVESMRRPIANNSLPGQAVYDPFVGSGTTIIAGEMTGRCVHALELNPAYVDVAVIRWQSFTGKTAVLEATGESLEATLATRSAGSASSATKIASPMKRKVGPSPRTSAQSTADTAFCWAGRVSRRAALSYPLHELQGTA